MIKDFLFKERHIAFYGIIIVWIIAFCLLFSIRKCPAKGTIEVGMQYNSNTKYERSNFLATIAEKKNDFELETSTSLLKEQENKLLQSLIIESDAQINYFTSSKMFYYAKGSYERNTEYGISDKTATNVGMGYKDYDFKLPYRLQGGFATQSIFYNSDATDKALYLNAGGDIKIPYKFLDLKENISLFKEIGAAKIELSSVSSIIANVSDNFFLSFSLNFSYLTDPPPGYVKDIKIYTFRGGINF